MQTKSKDKDEHYDRTKKESDEMFCYSCGSIVKINAHHCPKCGVSFRNVHFYTIPQKDKSTSILVSIFTSFFVWLYLYPKNSTKFWVGFLISLLSIIIYNLNLLDQLNWIIVTPLLVIWVFAIIDVSIKNKEYFKSFKVIKDE